MVRRLTDLSRKSRAARRNRWRRENEGTEQREARLKKQRINIQVYLENETIAQREARLERARFYNRSRRNQVKSDNHCKTTQTMRLRGDLKMIETKSQLQHNSMMGVHTQACTHVELNHQFKREIQSEVIDNSEELSQHIKIEHYEGSEQLCEDSIIEMTPVCEDLEQVASENASSLSNTSNNNQQYFELNDDMDLLKPVLVVDPESHNRILK